MLTERWVAGTLGQPCPSAALHCNRWLSTHLDVGAPGEVNLFETTIRVLGGLLSAQALSAGSHPALSRRLAEKAAELGARLMPAFSSPSGAPPAGHSVLSRAVPSGCIPLQTHCSSPPAGPVTLATGLIFCSPTLRLPCTLWSPLLPPQACPTRTSTCAPARPPRPPGATSARYRRCAVCRWSLRICPGKRVPAAALAPAVASVRSVVLPDVQGTRLVAPRMDNPALHLGQGRWLASLFGCARLPRHASRLLPALAAAPISHMALLDISAALVDGLAQGTQHTPTTAMTTTTTLQPSPPHTFARAAGSLDTPPLRRFP